jgi:hypothetical protein
MIGKPKPPSLLEKQVTRAIRALDDQEITSEEYDTILSRLKTLHGLQVNDKPEAVSKDTMLAVGANILGILLIIRHEHVNVITSRAMSMLTKPSKS